MTDSRLLASDLNHVTGITLAWRRIGQDMQQRGYALDEDMTARDQLLILAARLPEIEQAQLPVAIRSALAVRASDRSREDLTRLLAALARSRVQLTPDDEAAARDAADGLFAAGRTGLGQEILALLRDAKSGDDRALDDAISLAYATLPPAPVPVPAGEAHAYQRGRCDLAREMLRTLRAHDEAGACLTELTMLAYAQLPPMWREDPAPLSPDEADRARQAGIQAGGRPPLEPCTREDRCGKQPFPACGRIEAHDPHEYDDAGSGERRSCEGLDARLLQRPGRAQGAARLAAEILAESHVLGIHFQAPAEGVNGGVPGLFITLEEILGILARISPFRGLAGSTDADVLEAAARLVMRYGETRPGVVSPVPVRDYLASLAGRARELDEPSPDELRATARLARPARET